jgi:hypothetical protein
MFPEACSFCRVIVLGLVGLATLVAGIVVALTVHSLLGPLVIVAGVLAVGRVAFAAGLPRVIGFLSTGSWRRD